MPVTTRCPHCKKTLRAPEAAVGKKTRCPACKEILVFQAEAGKKPPVVDAADAGSNSRRASQPPSMPSTPPAKTTTRASAPPPLPSAPTSAKPKWHVQSYDGNQYGPVTEAELKSWIADGSITPKCQILREGERHWKKASDVFSQLSDAAPAAAPPTSTEGDAFMAAHLISRACDRCL